MLIINIFRVFKNSNIVLDRPERLNIKDIFRDLVKLLVLAVLLCFGVLQLFGIILVLHALDSKVDFSPLLAISYMFAVVPPFWTVNYINKHRKWVDVSKKEKIWLTISMLGMVVFYVTLNFVFPFK